MTESRRNMLAGDLQVKSYQDGIAMATDMIDREVRCLLNTFELSGNPIDEKFALQLLAITWQQR